jgi:hypothetical protein
MSYRLKYNNICCNSVVKHDHWSEIILFNSYKEKFDGHDMIGNVR